ncbi:MAG TPA: enoyl-CoA hydratase/isomerase family protein, partial [Terriglobales bacterium]|nr:enoyl-CoA hydratase/isomerase family protein [Terriglobales bacterium]
MNILYEVTDHVATITFHRPEARNALLPEMGDALVDLVRQAESQDDVRVIVLTGAGSAFSAGADIKLMGRGDRLGRSALVGRERNLHGSWVTEQLMQRQKPMIAAVNGVVAGMACAYVLACDFAIADAAARFVFGFIKLGFVPDSGSTYLLSKRIGVAQAQRIALLGEPIDAGEALRLGLVQELVDSVNFRVRVAQVTSSIAAQPPHAVRLTRTLIANA